MQDFEFPKMLYKAGGVEMLHGGAFSTLVVSSQSDQEAAIEEGWSLTTVDALESLAVAVELPEDAKPEDNDPPTREELQAKATELGIEFTSGTQNKTLAKLIAAKISGD